MLTGLALAWVVAGVVLLDAARARNETRLAETVAAASSAVTAARSTLLREARLLARDPTIAEGVARGDWSALARGASPRFLALTAEQVADLLLVLDGAGRLLVQVPAQPRLVVPVLEPPSAATTVLRVIGDHAYLIALAPVAPEGAARAAGTVAVGRRFEHLEPPLSALPSAPVLVAVAGQQVVASTRPELARSGWAAAPVVTFDGALWRAVRLDERDDLWLLVRGGATEPRRLAAWLVLSWVLAAVAVIWAMARPARKPAALRRAERMNRHHERTALAELGRLVQRAPDLGAGLAQALDVARTLTGADAAIVYRLDPPARRLQVVARRGVRPDASGLLASHPVDAPAFREVVRNGEIAVTRLAEASSDERRQLGGYGARVAVPVASDGRAWGVLVLLAAEDRVPGDGDHRLLGAIALLLGAGIAQATLRAETDARGRRLESLTALAQSLTATLALEDVLQRVVDAAVWILAAGVSRLWLLDDSGESLALRASAGKTSTVSGLTRMAVGDGIVGRVVAARKPMTVLDVGSDERVRNIEWVRSEGLVSAAGVPVVVGERVLGALMVGTTERHAYTADELELLQSLANHAAIAIDNARLFAEEKTRRDQLAVLLEINKRIGAAESTDALLTTIAEEAARLLGLDNAGFRLVEGEELVLAGLAGTARETMARPRIRIGESFSGKVVIEGRTVMMPAGSVPDMVPEHRASEVALGYTHYLGVPIRVADRTIGVFAFRARRPFTARDQELAETFAGQAAIVLEHARLYQEASRQAARMAALADIERALSSTLDPDVVARQIVASLCGLLAVQAASVYRLRPDSGDLESVAAAGAAASPLAGMVFPSGTGAAGQAVRERRPVVSADVLQDPRIPLPEEARSRIEAAGVRAVLAVPLIVHGRVIGALGVGDRAGRRFDDADLALTQALADQAATTLENARLYAETERRRREAEELARLARTFTESLAISAVGERVVESVLALCDVRSAGLRLLQPDGSLLAVAWGGVPPEATPPPVLPAGVGMAARALAEGRPVWSSDLSEEPDAVYDPDLRRHLTTIGHVAVLAVPLQARRRLVGVLVLTDDKRRRFADHEVALVQALADQAALALDNARLHGEAERGRREAEQLASEAAVLADLARTINASLDLDAVLRAVVDGARRLCHSDLARIAVREPGRGRMTFRHWAGARRAGALDLDLEPGRGVAGRAMETGRPFRTDDWMADPRLRRDEELTEVMRQEGIVAELAVPILIAGALAGILTVSNRTQRPFGDRDEAILGRLADHAAVAIRNAELYAQAREFGERLRALEEINRLVSSSLKVEDVVDKLAAALARVFDAPLVTVWGLDAAAQRLHRLLTIGGPEVDQDLLRDLAVGEGVTGAVVASREPVLWVDVEQDGRFIGPETLTRRGLRYLLVYPIAIGDRVLGAFGLARPTPAPVTEETRAILASLAAQAAVALDHARLYGEAQERLRETSTLLAIGRVLSEPLPREEMMRRVAREAARAFGADLVGAYAVDEAGERLFPVAGYHVPGELMEFFRTRLVVLARFPRFQRAWHAGHSVYSSDTHRDPEMDQEWVRQLPEHAILMAPLRVHGRSIGALFLVWWRPGRPFAAGEIRLVEAVAAQVGLALENIELQRQREVKLRETETLLSVSRSLTSTLDLDALLREFLRRVAAALEADTVAAYLPAEEGEFLIGRAGYRVPPERLAALRGLRISIKEHAFYEEAARTRRPVFSTDVATDPRIPDVVRQALAHRSQLFVPIVTKDRLVGGFIAAWLERERAFTDDELALVEAIAGQAGVAIENAWLFAENRRQVQELSVLHELGLALTGQLDRTTILDTVRQQVPRVLQARKLVVLFLDGEEAEVALRVLDGEVDAAGPRRYPRSVGLMSVLLETGRSLRTDDYAAECGRRGLTPPDVPPPQRLPRWMGAPLRAGSIMGALTVSRDDPPFTAADERLIANIADLVALALRSARLFEERARAYRELADTQDQLVRTEKLRALGEMASGVAHDFNNLLAAILGRAQLLQRRLADAQLRQWAQVIERAALDGAQTVRRLQEFSRVRRDEPRLPVDVTQVVRDAIEMTEARWREDSVRRGIVIEVRTALDPVPAVAGDAAELREALTNLILNAVDAMPQGGVLTLSTALVADGVQVTVSDTGVGIPAAVRSRIFDPFFTTKGPQGTGLGLAMTYGIVSRHGGRITVESEEGRGSTFRLTFPPAAVGSEAGDARATPPAAGRLRCLVVDDEPPVAAVIGDVLEALGHDAVVVDDGAAAIERVRAEPFDAVFTDLAMPGVSGWQVLGAVKTTRPELPVFLVTGFGVELTAAERAARGVEAVYAKPLSIDDIMDALGRVARRRVEREPSEGPS